MALSHCHASRFSFGKCLNQPCMGKQVGCVAEATVLQPGADELVEWCIHASARALGEWMMVLGTDQGGHVHMLIGVSELKCVAHLILTCFLSWCESRGDQVTSG